ncbi:MAG: hypothetical protein IPJ14_03800 [Kineosporiaceae bacterium]|nr:hypothetical protein [Kineosporiaceae bacterium]MBK7621790.1 hypothetical protein [Kineosporiaceae bacterium]MBK8077715.1 hypothetical protein [Kineosporiaceae bacterium]
MAAGSGRHPREASRVISRLLIVLAIAGIGGAIAGFIWLFVGISAALDGPSLRTPGERDVDLAGGGYTIYERYTGPVTYDRDGHVTGPYHQPGAIVAEDVTLTGPDGASVPVTDTGMGSSSISTGNRVWVEAARFEVATTGRHHLTISNPQRSEVVIAENPAISIGWMIVGIIVSMFLGIGALILRFLVLASWLARTARTSRPTRGPWAKPAPGPPPEPVPPPGDDLLAEPPQRPPSATDA